MTQAMRLCSPTTSILQVVLVGRSVFQFLELKVGSFHRVENRRLQVNDSTIRYQKQLGISLPSMI